MAHFTSTSDTLYHLAKRAVDHSRDVAMIHFQLVTMRARAS